jgi:hypothetical protein
MRARAALLALIAGCGDDLAAPRDAAVPTDAAWLTGGVPVVPVGYDAFRAWDRLPLIHVGERVSMTSTYDRAGGNEGADASHFVRETADAAGDPIDVALDVAGPGVLSFVRTNHWHGSPWHYAVDGADHVVAESSTATPDAPVAGSTFLPAEAFPTPLALTWSATHGADLSWVQIPFTTSLALGYGRTHYGTGYFIVHRYPEGAGDLSAPIATWDEGPPPDDVRDLLARAGTDLAPPGDEHDATIDLPAQGTAPALELAGPAQIRRLAIDAPRADAVAFGRAHLVITWDDRATPSVDAPIGLLFAGGSLYDRTGGDVLVAGLFASVTFDADQVHLALYFPMPFAARAQIALVGAGDAIAGVHVAARTGPRAPTDWQGLFHATFVDHGVPPPGHDLVLLDTQAAEGGGDWCGTFVGTSFTFSDRAVLSTLEGDPRFFFDDAQSPQARGTGTEEWAGGGDYWGGLTTTLPLAGHPTGAPDAASAQSVDDEIESAYRFLLPDAMPFGRNARIQLEHGGADDSTEHYRTVAYWYGRPRACLVQTDALHVGDPADEAAHAYASPTATAPQAITSGWDGVGVDSQVTTDTGRTMTGTSQLTLAIAPGNLGVLLRRTFDQAVPDQRAEIWIADDRDGAPYVRAGVWSAAGGATCLYSNPPGELDPPQRVVETADRRWREDEFLVPPALTAGRARIRVQVRFTPASAPLYPGAPMAAPSWSEVRYRAYSYVP